MFAVHRLRNFSVECRYRKTSLPLPSHYRLVLVNNNNKFLCSGDEIVEGRNVTSELSSRNEIGPTVLSWIFHSNCRGYRGITCHPTVFRATSCMVSRHPGGQEKSFRDNICSGTSSSNINRLPKASASKQQLSPLPSHPLITALHPSIS